MLTIKIDDLPYMPLNRSKMVVSKPRPMLIKTALCREFEKDLASRLEKYREEFERFKEYHKGNELEVKYNLFCPKSDYYTKDGEISSRCPDADSIKVLQDVLFKSIGVDDKYIKLLVVAMSPSHDEKWNYIIMVDFI